MTPIDRFCFRDFISLTFGPKQSRMYFKFYDFNMRVFLLTKLYHFFEAFPDQKRESEKLSQRAQAATTQQVEILLSIFGSASVTGQMSTWVSPPLWAKYIHKNEWVALLLIENLHFWRKFHIFGITVKMKLGISGTILKNVTQPLLTLLISLM